MATALKLRTDIKKLKAAISSSKTPKNFVPKLKAQLDKAENELASLKAGGEPRKASTTKGTKSLLEKAKALVKKNPKFAGYKGSGVDLKKDAGEGALPMGRRISKGLKANQVSGKGNAKQNKGNVYYEYRLNRVDIKQPKGKQSYPKLEDGGYMARGGVVKIGKKGDEEVVLRGMRDEDNVFGNYTVILYKNGESHSRFNLYTTPSDAKSVAKEYLNGSEKVRKEIEDEFKKAKGGYMARGGETKKAKWIETVNAKDVEDDEGYWENYEYATSKELMPSEGRYKGYRWVLTTNAAEPEGFWEKIEGGKYSKYGYMAKGGKTKDEPMVIRGYSDDEAYEYAQGGMLEHGLKTGDKIISYNPFTKKILVENEKSGEKARVDLDKGDREVLSGAENKMAHGGKLGAVHSKAHRYDK